MSIENEKPEIEEEIAPVAEVTDELDEADMDKVAGGTGPRRAAL
jgi:hypothetical protein